METELTLRGSVWYTDIRDASGKRIRESTRTTDKKLAEKRLAQLKTEIFEDRYTSKTQTREELTLQQGFDKALKQRWSKTKTYQTVQYNWDRLGNYLETSQKLSEVNRAGLWDVVEAMRIDEYSDASINRSMAVLGTILRLARDDWEVVGRVPKVPMLDEGTGRLRWLQEGEEERIVSWFRDKGDVDMADLIEVLLDTGCRVSEVLKLVPSTVQLFSSSILLLDTKNGKDAVQPLTSRALQIFKRRYKLEGSPFQGLTRHAAIHRFQVMKKHCGFEKDEELCLHSMRHTTASRLVMAGMDLKRVQAFMRHKDIATTLRYAHLDPKANAETSKALEKVAVKV